MSALTDLDTAWTTQIATIDDALVKAEATYALERYIAAIEQQTALEANEILSYSIAGRTVTRRDTAAGQNLIHSLRGQLWSAVYGGDSLGDMNTNVAEP